MAKLAMAKKAPAKTVRASTEVENSAAVDETNVEMSDVESSDAESSGAEIESAQPETPKAAKPTAKAKRGPANGVKKAKNASKYIWSLYCIAKVLCIIFLRIFFLHFIEAKPNSSLIFSCYFFATYFVSAPKPMAKKASEYNFFSIEIFYR